MLLALLACLMGIVLPGAWIAFAIRGAGLSYPARIALAVVLSPVVAAVQLFALREFGVSLERAVLAVLLVNIGSLLLVVRAIRRDRPRFELPPLARGTALFAAIVACLGIPWIADPAFRRFSWHGLLHTDIIYAIARGTPLPEDPELAGIALAYPWFGHLYWLFLAWAADVSPTVIYLISNIALLGATGVLAHALAKRLGASEPMAFATAALLALGVNIPGLIGWSIAPANDNGVWWAFFGDLRYSPFLLKFVTFEAMTFGLALSAALLLLVVAALERRSWGMLLVAILTVPATAALYPNLFPAAVMVLGGAGVAMLVRVSGRASPYTFREALLFAAISGVAIVASFLLVGLFVVDRGTPVATITPPFGLAKKTLAATIALGPFALAAWWAWRAETSAQTRRAFIALALAAAGAVALNIGMRMGGLNEYKFIFSAGMALVPIALIGLERRFTLAPRTAWGIVIALPIALAAVMAAYAGHRIPREGSTPFAVREGSFWLSVAPGNPEAAWTEAVRDRTPANTVLLINEPEFHASVFTGRSLLVPTEHGRPHFGYNLVSRDNLVKLRGYPVATFDERAQLLARAYAGGSDAEMRELLVRLGGLDRPIAVAFGPRDGHAFADWLRSRGIGEQLHEDASGRSVYYLSQPVLRQAIAELKAPAAAAASAAVLPASREVSAGNAR